MNIMKETIIRSKTEAFCWSEDKEVIKPHSNGVLVDMLRLAKVPLYTLLIGESNWPPISPIAHFPKPFVSSHLLENKKLPSRASRNVS